MSEPIVSDPSKIESPPASAVPAREESPDPRAQLHKLAAQLVRASDRKLLMEYLRLRRALG